jgi:hypothetical protein
MNLTKFKTLQLELSRSIEINLDNLDGVTIQDIQRHLDYILNDRNDGRYPFNVELLLNGLHGCIQEAVKQAVEEIQHGRYKGQYISSETEHSTSTVAKWVLVAEKVIKRLQCYFSESWRVRLKDE